MGEYVINKKGTIMVNIAADIVRKLKQQGYDLDNMSYEEATAVLDKFGDTIMQSIEATVLTCQKRWPTMADVRREVCFDCKYASGCFTKRMPSIWEVAYQCCEGMRAKIEQGR